MKRYRIIGAGIAGVTAAETLRRRDPAGEITLYHGGETPIYRAAFSTYAAGGIEREELLLRPRDWHDRWGIDLSDRRVEAVDASAKRITVGDETVPYDALLIATGAAPFLPPWPGADLPGVFTYRTIACLDRLREWLARRPTRAVVVGGGILSLELAELLVARGVKVTLVVREGGLLSLLFPPSFSKRIAGWMRDDGVTIRFETEVTRIDGDDAVRQVTLSDQSILDTDLVAVAVGVRPSTPLVGKCDVDDRLRVAGSPDVWAAGDCVSGAHRCGTWLTAAHMGERAGRNMTGDDLPFTETFFNPSHVWGRHYAVVGAVDPTIEGAPLHEGVPLAHGWREGDRLVGAAVIGDLRIARKAYAAIRGERNETPEMPYRLF